MPPIGRSVRWLWRRACRTALSAGSGPPAVCNRTGVRPSGFPPLRFRGIRPPGSKPGPSNSSTRCGISPAFTCRRRSGPSCCAWTKVSGRAPPVRAARAPGSGGRTGSNRRCRCHRVSPRAERSCQRSQQNSCAGLWIQVTGCLAGAHLTSADFQSPGWPVLCAARVVCRNEMLALPGTASVLDRVLSRAVAYAA